MPASAPHRKKKFYRGFLNRYQWSKPYSKYVAEDIRALFRWVYLYIRNLGRVTSILVYPHYPSKRSSIYMIANHLGYYITNRISDGHSIGIFWEYQTFRQEHGPLEELQKKRGLRILNLQSRDISKKHVDRIFLEVFGYSTFVDPTTHHGLCVEKGDINALHDGRVISCPVSTLKADKVYQLVINNETEGGLLVQDIRIPVFGNQIPFVYLKYRSIDERFKNTTVKTELRTPKDVLSLDEIKKTLAFCEMISLDHGELDALRDKSSGRLYIVDVNNTPQSPPANCSTNVRKKAIEMMSESFRKTFLN